MSSTEDKKRRHVNLGDLIEAALGEAGRLAVDPGRAAALAADAVTRILLMNGNRALLERLAAN